MFLTTTLTWKMTETDWSLIAATLAGGLALMGAIWCLLTIPIRRNARKLRAARRANSILKCGYGGKPRTHGHPR